MMILTIIYIIFDSVSAKILIGYRVGQNGPARMYNRPPTYLPKMTEVEGYKNVTVSSYEIGDGSGLCQP